MLMTDRERHICAKYSTPKVRCSECPLRKPLYGDLTCKATSHWDSSERKWVTDDWMYVESNESVLSGFHYGKELFEQCSKECRLRKCTPCKVYFSERVDTVSASFVRGFFDYWLKMESVEDILKYVKIDSYHDAIRKEVEHELQTGR